MRFLALALSLTLVPTAVADDWPQWLGPKRDGVWRETGILDQFPAGGPKVLWDVKVGAGYAGPAVAGGKVFVMDRVGTKADGTERVLCLDQKTGAELWKHEYPAPYRISYSSGPRCTPSVDGDRVYALGAMGHLFCLDAKTGAVVWSKDFLKDYNAKLNIWGFSAHPLIDGDKLVCLVGGSDGRVVVAFDKKTGKELWASQALDQSEAGYCPPVIYDLAGRRTLVVWHSRAVVGLDPDTGKRFWSHPWQIRFALTAPMPRQLDGDRLFLTAFYDGPLMLKVGAESAPGVAWKGKGKSEKPNETDGLHSIIPTPDIQDGHIYGVCSYGELRCLKADTGERVWSTRKPTTGTATEEGKEVRWANAFLTPNGDRHFLFNDQGELIIARLSPKGYEEVSRAKVVRPTNKEANRPVVWTHPAYAGKCLFVRNDEKMVCVSLAR